MSVEKHCLSDFKHFPPLAWFVLGFSTSGLCKPHAGDGVILVAGCVSVFSESVLAKTLSSLMYIVSSIFVKRSGTPSRNNLLI